MADGEPQITREDTHAAALRAVGLNAYGYEAIRLGRCEGVLVDRQDGQVQWLQLRLPGFSGAFIGLPLDGFAVRADRLRLHLSVHMVAEAPRIPATGVLTSRLERTLCAHFGVVTRGGKRPAWERRATSARLIAPGLWEPEPRGDEPAPPLHPGRRPIGLVHA